jgi:predicted DNA-binding antitoxin AbrB/MazE fold protein
MAILRSVHAIYENGTLRLLEPVELKEGEEVVVQIPVVEETPKIAGKRIPNLHPDAFEISDDFDAPLPDSFWLGEDE